MLNLNSIMIGTQQPKVLIKFYEEVFNKEPDMREGEWGGWQIGNTFVNIGEHSQVKGKSKEPQRIILNLETNDVKKEFERIKKTGATVVKEPYEMSNEDGSVSGGEEFLIATFEDPDGNYFQLMSPWKSST